MGCHQVWNVKFPVCIVPHAWMNKKSVGNLGCAQCDLLMVFVIPPKEICRALHPQVKEAMHAKVAQVTTWSMRCALKGKAPDKGPFGEALDTKRGEKAGKDLANGFHFAYVGFKADAKARRECHRFDRTYGHNKICECCFAERPNKHGDPLLTFKNFYPNAAHSMTELSHQEYLQSTATHSPWESMPGFHVKTCFRDPMHTIFLGTAKEMIASCLGYWCRNKYVPGNDLHEQLREVSMQQKLQCKNAGLRGAFKTYTPSNTGLDKSTEYPELGSSFKAAMIKTSLWFHSKIAGEFSTAHPKERVQEPM